MHVNCLFKIAEQIFSNFESWLYVFLITFISFAAFILSILQIIALLSMFMDLQCHPKITIIAFRLIFSEIWINILFSLAVSRDVWRALAIVLSV